MLYTNSGKLSIEHKHQKYWPKSSTWASLDPSLLAALHVYKPYCFFSIVIIRIVVSVNSSAVAKCEILSKNIKYIFKYSIPLWYEYSNAIFSICKPIMLIVGKLNFVFDPNYRRRWICFHVTFQIHVVLQSLKKSKPLKKILCLKEEKLYIHTCPRRGLGTVITGANSTSTATFLRAPFPTPLSATQ